MQAAITPRSFFEVSVITTSRVPWMRRAAADHDRGEHMVRTPTGKLEVYRDPRGLEPTPPPPPVRHDVDDPRHRAVCRQCRRTWKTE
jgi:hypothetical protein